MLDLEYLDFSSLNIELLEISILKVNWSTPYCSCDVVVGHVIIVIETLCGPPPTIESTGQEWNSNSAPGSTVLYFCKEGFYYKGGHNISVCDENGLWTTPTLSCQGNDEDFHFKFECRKVSIVLPVMSVVATNDDKIVRSVILVQHTFCQIESISSQCGGPFFMYAEKTELVFVHCHCSLWSKQTK